MVSKGGKKTSVLMARVYVDDPGILFIYNGMFWTPAKLEEVEDVVAPVVTVVATKKYVCKDVTIKEALANYNKCEQTQ